MGDRKSNVNAWTGIPRHPGLAPQLFGSVAALCHLRPNRSLGGPVPTNSTICLVQPMISPETRAEIRRYFYAEHGKVGTIARELRVHADTVRHANVTVIEGDSYRVRESEQETAARRRKK